MLPVLIQKQPGTDPPSNQTAPYLRIHLYPLIYAHVRFCLSTSIVLSKLILFPLDSADVLQLPGTILI